ncbi:MAG TPA: hypothetical protein PKX07_18070, partial [Aggregatilineales bacterium]|nr:hypothetical protein [Aggregatilineales bacterium]
DEMMTPFSFLSARTVGWHQADIQVVGTRSNGRDDLLLITIYRDGSIATRNKEDPDALLPGVSHIIEERECWSNDANRLIPNYFSHPKKAKLEAIMLMLVSTWGHGFLEQHLGIVYSAFESAVSLST